MKNETRTYGVEIEIARVDQEAMRIEFRQAGIPLVFPGYTHEVMASWKVVPDGSVPGGCELVSPKLAGEAGLETIRKVCGILNRIGARVSRRCGLHVHHQVRDYSPEQFGRLFNFYRRAEAEVDSFMAISRRGFPRWQKVLYGLMACAQRGKAK